MYDYFGNLDIEEIARARFSSGRPDALLRQERYEQYHRWYAPAGGDQWPEDLLERPGKIHITENIIRRFIDTEARLLSIKPRMTIRAQPDEEQNRRAEATEKLFEKWLQQSGFNSWYFTFEQTKALYGLGVLKVFWNDKTKQPDVIVVEQPQNLMLGWGDSEFLSLDWSIYHYKISKLQARMKYPNCPEEFLDSSGFDTLSSVDGANSHSDPLSQMSMLTGTRIETDYERSQVSIWDYWYLDDKANVWNAILLNGNIVEGPTKHLELPSIPYVVAEHDHEPGSPDGRGTAELLIDIQDGLNRAMSHYAQYIWDNSDPAYQLAGPEAPMTIPDGLVPRPGEIIAPGPNARVELINMGVNNFPFDALIAAYWNQAHRITGLSEVLFGIPSSAQSSGRAIAIQLESSINALEPKRQRSYTAIETVLMMWHHIAKRKNPVLAKARTEEVDDPSIPPIEIPEIRAKDVIEGMTDWVIIAPEITPRDVVEHTQNTINKINAKLMSNETGMNEIGIENPLEELDRIRAERTDAQLYPGDAQGTLAVAATAQQLGIQQGAIGAAAEGMAAQDAALADRQEAQPGLMEDQNQVPTAQGMPPGEGGQPLGGQFKPIVRQGANMQSMPMSEIALPRREI